MVTTSSLKAHSAELGKLQSRQRPEGIPPEPIYPAGPVTIPAHVTYWAARRLDHLALVFGDEHFIYAALDDAHRRIAAWLATQGVGRGDRMAVYLGNSAEMVRVNARLPSRVSRPVRNTYREAP
jgi:non-ribosomal peptide synthetase component F